MTDVKIGDQVEWFSSYTRKHGILLAIVPADTSIRAVTPACKPSHIKYDNDLSPFERALVKVMGGVDGCAEYYYGPRASLLKKYIENPVLTIDQMEDISNYEDDTAIWIQDHHTHVVRAIVDISDGENGRKIVGVWNSSPRDWYKGKDYLKTWKAYRFKP